MQQSDADYAPLNGETAQEWFHRLLDGTDPLIIQLSRLQVMPGSLMEGDDAGTPVDRMSWQVKNLGIIAINHIETLADAVLSTGQVRAFGPYPLIRASIEASCIALWIMNSNRRDTRVLRSLRYSAEEMRKANDFAAKAGGDATAASKPMLRRLNDAREGRKALRSRHLDTIDSATSMFLDIRPLFRDAAVMDPLVAWSACSSVAHANKVTASIVLDVERQQLIGETASVHMVRTDQAMAAELLATALTMIRRLALLAEERGTTIA